MSDEFDSDSNAEKPWWSEAVKDITSVGLATLFMTEDSIRTYLKEKKLPKEMVGDFLEGIGRKKNDFYGAIGKEMGRVFSSIDLTKEMTRFLENHSVKFEGKISFEKRADVKDGGSDHE